MTQRTKAAVKLLFESGDKPTQTDFADMIDSYQDRSGVLDAIVSAAGSFGMIEIQSSASATTRSAGAFGLQMLSVVGTASALTALGAGTVGAQILSVVATASALGIIGYPAAGTAGNSLIDTGSAWSSVALNWSFRNLLINGDGRINQIPSASTADDVYGGPDLWYCLNQSNAVTPAQGTDGESGTPFYDRTTQANAGAQRFGRAHIVESSRCRHTRGGSATLSARVRMSATTTLRYAILEWTGTADAPTSDVVNDWTSATFTGGNFFVSTTTNVLATGSVALTANTWASITPLTGTVGASMNNLIVIFWTDSTQAQNVTLDLSRRQLEGGAAATPFEYRDSTVEMQLVRWLYERWTRTASADPITGAGDMLTTTDAYFIWKFDEKRIAPAVAFSNVADFQVVNAAAGTADASNIAASAITPRTCRLVATVPATTAGQGALLQFDATAGGFLSADARL